MHTKNYNIISKIIPLEVYNTFSSQDYGFIEDIQNWAYTISSLSKYGQLEYGESELMHQLGSIY